MTSAEEPRRSGAAPASAPAAPAAAAALVIREKAGAPSVPAEAREDLLALKSAGIFLCARPDGDIRAGPLSGEGLYARDTRHLSELHVTVGGHAPVLLSSAMESGHHAIINGTNPTLRTGHGEIAQETINIRRTLLVGEQLHYEVCLRNFGPRPARTTLELSLGADFADVFEVRRVGRQTEGNLLAPTRDGSRVRFGYAAEDGERRTTDVELTPSPTRIELDDRRAHAVWDVEIAHGEAHVLSITVDPDRRDIAAAAMEQVATRLDLAHRAWEGACARVTTDNELFNRLIAASVRDVHALMMPVAGSALPAAGIPWYVAPFGRDSLLTACEILMFNPDVARGTLTVLAGLQASEDEPWRDAEPGKILHELRTGELARTGRIPHTPYYGTVDATQLYLAVAGAYFRWTRDVDTMRQLRPSFDAALEWIDRWGDRDGDGFVEYERRSPAGLQNQGWKDSHDSIVHADGTLAEGPIALVEVQGYVYEAKLRIAEVYEALGDGDVAARLRAQAGTLRRAFNHAFWDAEEGYFALALDGRKRQVRSVASNAAHCLYCGIVDDDKAPSVAERLMAPDMYSGWGIRTLSARSPAYNPMSYHNGSVWPHDNAIAAAGLKRYGFHEDATRIAGGLFDVAVQARDFRLPELFCGFPRNESRSPVAYPVACIPQAWASAAPYLLLQALLGVSADGPDNRLTVDRPTLPAWLGSVEVHGIRVGASRVSLSFRQTGIGATGFALLANEGNVRVTMSA